MRLCCLSKTRVLALLFFERAFVEVFLYYIWQSIQLNMPVVDPFPILTPIPSLLSSQTCLAVGARSLRGKLAIRKEMQFYTGSVLLRHSEIQSPA